MSPKIREDIQSKIKKKLQKWDPFNNPENGLYELFRALLELIANNKTIWEINKIESPKEAFSNLIGVECFQI